MQDLKSNLISFLETLINCSPNNSPTCSVPVCVAFAEVRAAVGSLHWRNCLCGGSTQRPLQQPRCYTCDVLPQFSSLQRLGCLVRLLHTAALALVERKKFNRLWERFGTFSGMDIVGKWCESMRGWVEACCIVTEAEGGVVTHWTFQRWSA